MFGERGDRRQWGPQDTTFVFGGPFRSMSPILPSPGVPGRQHFHLALGGEPRA